MTTETKDAPKAEAKDAPKKRKAPSKENQALAQAIFESKIAVYDKQEVAINVAHALGLEDEEFSEFVQVAHSVTTSYDEDGELEHPNEVEARKQARREEAEAKLAEK